MSKTFMTLHVKQDGEWVYVPDMLTPKWGEYGSMKSCMSWKGKLNDVIQSDTALVQCVTPAVKAKFDNPVIGEANMVVIPQPEFTAGTDTAYWAVGGAGVAIAIVVAYVLVSWLGRDYSH